MEEGLGIGKRKLIDEIIKKNWKTNNPTLFKFSYKELLYIFQEFLTDEGKLYLEKRTDGMGHARFRKFVEHLLYRNLANYDSMVLLTGDKGSGKSSVAMMIAKYWCKLIGIRFDPKRHLAYNNADLVKKIAVLKKFEPIVADEAVRFCTTEEWAKKENKKLKIKLAQVRTKHLLFILCFPLKVEKVDKVYLESFVNYWVDIFGRGLGAAFVKDRNPAKDAWRIKSFSKIGSYNEFTSITQVEKVLKKHPNFWTTMRFPKPSKTLYSRYLEVREKTVYDDDNVVGLIGKEDIYKALLVLALRDIMQHDQSLTMNRIILHLKNEYDIALTKTMIEDTIKDSEQMIKRIKENVSVIDDK